MREKFTFENPGKNALMAEILARRNRQPRMTFLTSLTAVMAAAISLTAVCGSLPANAIPVEQPSQPDITEVTEVIAEHSAETPPAEIVTRVHTETKIEPVTEYHELVLTPAAVSQADADVAAYPETGTSLFSQEQQRYQWQFGDEIFTFFVKAETLYRRSETTGKITAVYRGEGDISLLCVTDRYLFFKADVLTTDVVFGNYTAYCYRADLLTGDICGCSTVSPFMLISPFSSSLSALTAQMLFSTPTSSMRTAAMSTILINQPFCMMTIRIIRIIRIMIMKTT